MPYGTLIPDGTITAAKLAAGVIPAASELAVGFRVDWDGTFDATHKPDAGTWLECDGSSLLRADYPDLFAAIGTIHGNVDGTHFTLPNWKRRVSVGRDNAAPSAGCAEMRNIGSVSGCGGEEFHTLTGGEMPLHGHCFSPSSVLCSISGSQTQVASGSGPNVYYSIYGSGASPSVGNCGSGTPHNTLQPYVVTYKLIKARKAS